MTVIIGQDRIKAYTWIFTAAQFMIAPNWKQLKYQLTGEWIDKYGMYMDWNTADR